MKTKKTKKSKKELKNKKFDIILKIKKLKGKQMERLNGELVAKVENWARERDILENGQAQSQYLKMLEELGELAIAVDEDEIIDAIGDTIVVMINLNGILKTQHNIDFKIADIEFERSTLKLKNIYNQILSFIHSSASKVVRQKFDNLGQDFKNLLSILASIGYDLNSCLNVAYDEIKDRKGKLLPNGNFVKEEDFEKYGIKG